MPSDYSELAHKIVGARSARGYHPCGVELIEETLRDVADAVGDEAVRRLGEWALAKEQCTPFDLRAKAQLDFGMRKSALTYYHRKSGTL